MCAKMLGIRNILMDFSCALQLTPVHCMVLCNINSLFGTLPSHKTCISTKLNICKLYDVGKIWNDI